jgi:hypothetical protein
MPGDLADGGLGSQADFLQIGTLSGTLLAPPTPGRRVRYELTPQQLSLAVHPLHGKRIAEGQIRQCRQFLPPNHTSPEKYISRTLIASNVHHSHSISSAIGVCLLKILVFFAVFARLSGHPDFGI